MLCIYILLLLIILIKIFIYLEFIFYKKKIIKYIIKRKNNYILEYKYLNYLLYIYICFFF
jgi:hypothetical protein